MHTESFNDDVLFDRLVDGELTGIERRRLLESLDERPDSWRRCALAFLEAQSWREDLGQLARSSREAADEAMPTTSTVQPASKSQGISGVQWLALAASLLLAFGLGWIERQHGEQFAGSAPKNNVQVAKVAPPSIPAPGGDANDELTMFVLDKSGNKQPVRIPLVDAGTLDEQLGVKFQPGLSDQVRKQLKDKGYNVQSKRQYARMWLENGRPMIVPVEDTKIVPVGNKVSW